MQNPKTLMKVGVVGTVAAALCCFTPILLILLAVVGLSALSCRIAAPTVGSVSQGCSVLPIFLGLLAAV